MASEQQTDCNNGGFEELQRHGLELYCDNTQNSNECIRRKYLMSNPVCQFVWIELTTTDLDGADAFYKQVIGWSIADAGMTADRYSIASAGPHSIAGMMAINAEMKARSVPPCWTGYIGVSDVDLYVAKVTLAGGAVHLGPKDIPGVGRFAVVNDPWGAVFILFKAAANEVPPLVAARTPGHVGWHELFSTDREAAMSFYADLFGWTLNEALDMGAMGSYQLFSTGAESVGGIMTKPPAVPVSCWCYYLNVESAKDAVERVIKAGGQLLMGPHQVPGGGWIANCLDPQGAYFSIIGPQ
jgi:uncharacterized protein